MLALERLALATHYPQLLARTDQDKRGRKSNGMTAEIATMARYTRT